MAATETFGPAELVARRATRLMAATAMLLILAARPAAAQTSPTAAAADTTTSTVPCDAVKPLIQQGRLDDAVAALASASAACADQYWPKIDAQRVAAARDLTAGATALAAGHYTAAVQSLQQSVVEDKSSPAAALLDDARTERDAHDHESTVTSWSNTAQQAGTLLLWAIGSVIVLSWVIYLIGRTFYGLSKPVRYRVQPLDDPQGVPVGAALTAAILAELSNEPSKGTQSLSMVNDEADKPDLPDVSMLPDALRLAVSLLSWIPRPHVRTVTGRAYVANGKANVTVTIRARGHSVAVEQFSAAIGPDQAATFLSLAPLIASWLYFTAPSLRLQGSPAQLLGTDDWRSYGLFRQGVTLDPAGANQARRRQKYLAALEQDSSNLGALINLASLDVASTDVDRLAAAISHLADARQRLEEEASAVGTDANLTDPQWFRLSYLLAVSELHLLTQLEQGGAPTERLDDIGHLAYDHAIQLAIDTCRTLLALDGHDELVVGPRPAGISKLTPQQADDLRGLLESSEYRVIVLAASAAMESGRPHGGADPEADAERTKHMARLQQPPPSSATLEQARRAWFGAPSLRLLGHASIMKALHHFSAHAVEPADDNERLYQFDLYSYSAQYNIACYQSRLSAHGGPYVDQLQAAAMDALTYALGSGPDLVDWARRDPALAALRAGRPEPFAQLVGPAPPAHA